MSVPCGAGARLPTLRRFCRAALMLAPLLLLFACDAFSPDNREIGIGAAPQSIKAPPRQRGVSRSNTEIASDFIDLNFALESGQTLPRLQRFEGPVSVALDPALGAYRPELARLLERIRREAQVPIAETPFGEAASIVIEGRSASSIQRVFPTASCFIIPEVSSWEEFQRRDRAVPSWQTIQERQRVAIFVPLDASPHEVRDCLHEELLQSLGPLNDLYRLPDSVFNDDNFQPTATAFDMLILRTLYDPAMRSGLSRAEATSRLPSVLARLNPRGEAQPTTHHAAESREWQIAYETALWPDNSERQRLEAARRAVAIARTMDPQDHRLASALLAEGRALTGRDRRQASELFSEAYELLRALYGETSLRTAHAAFHLGILTIATEPQATLEIVQRAIPAAIAEEDGVLLYGLHAIRGRALEDLGDPVAARRARMDSLQWARYAFGAADDRSARMEAQIAKLDPLR